jgi:dTDP-4-amino-4,6-dideoxygalactose transaminase
MKTINHSKPTLGNAEIAALARVIKSGFITSGPEVAAFEREFAAFHELKHAVAVNSGVSALHIALESIGVRGREVIVPSYACSALLNAVNLAGGVPAVADVDRITYNLTPETAAAAMTKNTAAIIAPHILGCPADIAGIKKLGVPVVEDCAMALGAFGRGGLKIRGDAAIFSFYGTKMMATGQGGMVLTNNSRIAGVVRDLITYDCRDDYKLRYNYQMTDVAAAMGRAQMKPLPSFVRARRSIAKFYFDSLKDLPLGMPPRATGHAYFRFAVEVAAGVLDKTIKFLERALIEAKKAVYKPLHRYLKLSSARFPNTEEIYSRALSIPIYPSLGIPGAKKVVCALGRAIGT